MNTINALVVDDEPLAIEVIQNYAKRIPYLNICKNLNSAIEAADALEKDQYDLLILDIKMPQISGVEFVKSLTNPPSVIFTTAYSDYAVDGFNLNAVDYLLKPFKFDRFLRAIQKVKEKLEVNNPDQIEDEQDVSFIYVKADKKLTKIKYDQIYFIEGLKDYVIIKRENDRIVTLQTMKGLEERLPSNLFLRIHRSYIVALDKIEAVIGNSIELRIGQEKKLIPIGKNYRDEILAVVNKNRL